MAKGSKRKHSSARRGRKLRGGALAPLESGAYPGSGAGQWNTSVNGNAVAAAASNYKSLIGGIAAESGGAGMDPNMARINMARFAMTGPGQSGGGSRRRKNQRKSFSKTQRQGQTQTQGHTQTQGQTGGMFATFGALLKEALVPLGLLAAQQTYGKSYDSKHRTRKNRK